MNVHYVNVTVNIQKKISGYSIIINVVFPYIIYR